MMPEKKIEVTVKKEDAEDEIKRLKEALEEKSKEHEDAITKLNMVANKEFEEKCRKLGAPNYIRTPEELAEWNEQLKNKAHAERKADPHLQQSSGTLSLSSQHSNENDPTSYDSHEEMVDDLRRRASAGTELERREAKAILDELMRKDLEGIKEGRLRQQYEAKISKEDPLMSQINKEFWKRQKMKKRYVQNGED